MKRSILTKSMWVLAMSALMLSTGAFAQMGPRAMNMRNDSLRNFSRIPNLTTEQRTKIQDLRTKHLKDVTPLRNELREKKAHLITLESADKPDINAINKTIDEITTLNSKMMKLRASHRMEVASLLTDEQKLFFNTHQGKMGRGNKGNGMGMGPRRGNGPRGVGNCPGCPYNTNK